MEKMNIIFENEHRFFSQILSKEESIIILRLGLHQKILSQDYEEYIESLKIKNIVVELNNEIVLSKYGKVIFNDMLERILKMLKELSVDEFVELEKTLQKLTQIICKL